VAVTDCLNFGSPEKPDGYYQLSECIEGMAQACEAFETPVVSGNVSLFNETDQGAVYPTPTVGMVGIFEDVSRHATPAFKREGDMVVIVGEPVGEARNRPLDGSEYLEIVHGKVAGVPAKPNLLAEKKYSDLIRGFVADGIVDTVHDLSGGGEFLALAEMVLAGGIGFEYGGEVEREELLYDGRGDAGLFGERGACFLIAVPEARWDDLQDALIGSAYDFIGYTGGDRFKAYDLIDVGLSELRHAYERDLFERHAPAGGHIG
ncbi:MAG: AIR synthase related protein, partial [Actinomycetota bacterium]|nr:AIR synthase related protein [Actinomycetota bacterium]